MKAVGVQNLVKKFGKLVAVNELSFEIQEGEIYGLLGPNGAGKTTTIKVLMGLLDPDSGKTEVFGIDTIERPIEVKKLVGYVPEEQHLYESLTSRELFEFIASVRGIDSVKANRRAKEMARALDFEKHYNKTIITLSQGNRQKCILIAAMLHAPKLLILDEPFSGLDVRTTRILKDVVRIHTETGGSVLFSTHIMETAEDMCDRVGIIDEGIMVGEGTLNELQTQAKEEGATLEKLFLRLTRQESEVRAGVDTLREALRE